jgi:antitoxin ParD1/3/4
MRRYLIAPLAVQDMDDISAYIAQDSPIAAKKMLDSFFTAMDTLVDNPKIGHTRPDLTNRPVRFWSVKSRYFIIYKNSDPIEIVRVLSSYRDITNLLL